MMFVYMSASGKFNGNIRGYQWFQEIEGGIRPHS